MRAQVATFIKFFLLAVIVGLSVLFFSYHLAYAKKVIPGVKVVDIALGNKNRNGVRAALGAKFNDRATQPVKLVASEKTFEFSLEELGVGYDLDRTVAAVFAVGRGGNLFEDLETEIRAWFQGIEVGPVLVVERGKLDGVLLEIAEELDDPPAEAKFETKGGELNIVKAKSGRMINQEQLKERILVSLGIFSITTIRIPLEDIIPEITASGLEAIRPQIEEILATDHKLVYGKRVWTPTKEEFLTFIKLQKQDSAIEVGADEGKLFDYISKLANQINRDPKGDLFRVEGERVVEFRLASNGLELDEAETLKLLSAAILGLEETVELPVKVSQTPPSANEYGIKQLLGQGVSNFSGSSQGRINNIRTASAKLRGILITPGETFSFNKSLGEVSAATGYDTAWIIKGGRTVLGVGGGVCQVSTTVFRAAFNSGLEILERTAHAYRVHYYEPPVGFDATVYDPSPDLVFKNDTGSYVLVWSCVDVPNTTLTFSFYGTSDGRSTQMVGPFVSGETPPPASLYQEDSRLPKGVTQQIDFAAWGANAVLKREVYRDGKIIHNDTFTSHFKPWQAVFLVGTKE